MPAMTRTVPEPKKANVKVGEPNEESIRLRAYEIYLARGAQPGRDAEDWEQAKRELTMRNR